MQTMEDKTQLRKFGFVLAFGLMIPFGLVFPLLKEASVPMWPYVAALVLVMLSLIKPALLNLIYGPWMKLGHYLGWVNTRIILGFIFYLMITPMGIVMRLFGKDAMQRRYQPELSTYRKKSVQNPPQHMEKPF